MPVMKHAPYNKRAVCLVELPRSEQAMMNMPPIGRENGRFRNTRRAIAIEVSRRGSETAISGADKPSRVVIFWPHIIPKAAQEKTNGEASAIAEENRSRVEVKAQKSKKTSGQRNCRQGQRQIVIENRRHNHGCGGEEAGPQQPDRPTRQSG